MSTAEEYINKHHILTYLEDAVVQLLSFRDTGARVDVKQFFHDYFKSVKDGNHTLMREYAFIVSTPYNRACFIHQFYQCFAVIGKKDLMTTREYHNLVAILCRDFPYEHMQKTAKIILTDDAHDHLIAFTDFLYAFQLQFYFHEFLDDCHSIYQSLLDSPVTSKDIVVPTDHTSHVTKPVTHNNSAEGIESNKFLRALNQLADKNKNKYPMPSQSCLKEVLSESERVTFYNFLQAMSKSEQINSFIGKLPTAADVFKDINTELPAETTTPTPRAPPTPQPVQNVPSPVVTEQSAVRRSAIIASRAQRRSRTLRATRTKTQSSDTDSSDSSSDTDD